MTKATIDQAKHHLSELVDAALKGEEVVIFRGAKPSVAIVPVAANYSSALRVSDAAATYLANEARTELAAGAAQVHESPAAFAAAITKPRRRQ